MTGKTQDWRKTLQREGEETRKQELMELLMWKAEKFQLFLNGVIF